MEIAIILALCFGASAAVVAKVEQRLGARGGTVGAARGVARYATGQGRVPAMTVGKTTGSKGGSRSGKKARTGSSTRTVDTRPQPTSIREAARMGWADGVKRATEKRAAGKDLVGRTRRATKWTADKAGRLYTGAQGIAGVRPAAKKKEAERQAKLDAAKATHTTETQDPPAPAAGKPETEKENNPMTVPTTELASIDQFRAEAQKGREMIANVQEALAAYQGWAKNLNDRATGAGVSTEPILAAVGTITESATPEVKAEASLAGCEALVKACDDAKAAAEALAALRAKGNVEAYA